jgi:hypothetical protein
MAMGMGTAQRTWPIALQLERGVVDATLFAAYLDENPVLEYNLVIKDCYL